MAHLVERFEYGRWLKVDLVSTLQDAIALAKVQGETRRIKRVADATCDTDTTSRPKDEEQQSNPAYERPSLDDQTQERHDLYEVDGDLLPNGQPRFMPCPFCNEPIEAGSAHECVPAGAGNFLIRCAAGKTNKPFKVGGKPACGRKKAVQHMLDWGFSIDEAEAACTQATISGEFEVYDGWDFIPRNDIDDFNDEGSLRSEVADEIADEVEDYENGNCPF